MANKLTAETGRTIETITADLTNKADLARVETTCTTIPASLLVNNAGLGGLDLGELVTIPALPDAVHWHTYEAVRQTMAPQLSRDRPPARY